MADRRPATLLVVPRSIATKKVREVIKVGKELRNHPARRDSERDIANASAEHWCGDVKALLSRIVSDDSLAEQFGSWKKVEWTYIGDRERSEEAVERKYGSGLESKFSSLELILSSLEIYPEAPEQTRSTQSVSATGTEVFVVHGHDHGTKETVARFIEKLGLEAIVLHEQPSRNMAIIEKFEQHSDVAFAVVLLTPDDIGYPKSSPDQARPRARQNVVLELGYFTGRLGRGRVCCLVVDDVEIPSDYAGVLYVQIDSSGAWRTTLAKEMKAAGCPVDMNKV